MKTVTAKAHANIALVKYWGKRDVPLNLPAASSLSMTLEGLTTTTTVRFDDAARDRLILNGQEQSESALGKVVKVLDAVRTLAGIERKAIVTSENDFPTGAGLASSASSMAALALASSRAAGLNLSERECSGLARLGSGSASRSIFGGTVVWDMGTESDGSDSVARMVYPPDHWDLRVLVAVVSDQEKPIGSTEGMNHTRATSPFFDAYLQTVPRDIDEALAAIQTRDIKSLGVVAERSCLRMHATMMGADPPVQYLRSASYRIMDRVRSLRADGAPVFFTADAGPNIKVFCEADAMSAVRDSLESMDGISSIIEARVGQGARVVSED